MAARGWQHRSMRYEPSQRLLRLARHLAASRSGLTLDEMAIELEVGRRTAERLRDSLAAMFPQMECWDDDERVVHRAASERQTNGRSKSAPCSTYPLWSCKVRKTGSNPSQRKRTEKELDRQVW